MVTTNKLPTVLTSQVKVKEEVSNLLENILAQHINQAGAIDNAYADLLRQASSLVARGGKRLRPILTVLSYEGYGGTNHQAILPVAASQELFHAFILMHDDIIDRDDWRWGGPNISGHYRKKFSSSLSSANAQHFGDAWALLAGDACLSMSIETLRSSQFPAEMVLQGLGYVHNTLFRMIGGELVDTALSLNLPKLAPAKSRLLNVCRYKTSTYSFCTPLQLGALFAGANQNTLQKIEDFGIALGIAYQIRDDLLGMFGTQKEIGKPAITDLREGKQTLLIANLKQLASEKQWKIVKSYLGNSKVTEKQLCEVRDILNKTGAKTRTEQLAKNYVNHAQHLLPQLSLSADATNHLRNLTDFAVARTC